MPLARVIKSAKREFSCEIIESKKMVMANALGNLLKNDESVVVGDLVDLEILDNGDYQITCVHERKSEIHRILIRESKRKVIASNVDCIVVVASVSVPAYKRGLVDRFLVRAMQWDLPCYVVFNKMDQYDQNEFDIYFEVERLKNLNVTCFEISAKFPDYKNRFLPLGKEDLKQALHDKLSIFLGHSGVGKSKTISMLTEGKFTLKTQEVGKKGKGSHTTTWSEIIDCGDFYLIDSPGIRTFSLDDINPQELDSYFPDLIPYFSSCKFSNCQHEERSVGCSFRECYQDAQDNEGRLVLSRLNSYKRLLEEVSALPHWKKKSY